MNDGGSAIAAVLCLILVGSALAARQLPLGKAAKLASAWLLIFVVAFAAYAMRDDFAALGDRMMLALDPETGRVSGGTLRIPMAGDGHFWVRGTVNGVETRFLVDSGATTTALSDAAVNAAGVKRTGGFPVELATANGVIRAERARIDRLTIGPIDAGDVPVVTSPAFGDTNVLGMNFLSALRSWGVEGRTLVLTP